jgi:hypothetical protein
MTIPRNPPTLHWIFLTTHPKPWGNSSNASRIIRDGYQQERGEGRGITISVIVC